MTKRPLASSCTCVTASLPGATPNVASPYLLVRYVTDGFRGGRPEWDENLTAPTQMVPMTAGTRFMKAEEHLYESCPCLMQMDAE